ncbi:piggyBac transposable element-derived protein 3 [Trichinella spiralis]|uniref:piggyBac transposable element-derived protein 3 n=1 Tax=Trichinella spiralis TaxID=6334 RepID=UPI0001EFE819|nr:piggyBac transposable element-derived protein 3 [Trichinella spiralis]
MGILSCRTIRPNRFRGCPLLSEKDLKSKGRGAYDFRTDAKKGIIAVAWYDNRRVTATSTYRGIKPKSTVKRWDGRQRKVINVQIPNILKNYNMNMGSIDLNNMLAALHRIEHKSRKWIRRIFFWIISTAMTNAWQLYKRDRKEMPGTCTGTLDLLSFTCQVSQSLCLVNKSIATSRSHSRASSPTPALTSRRLGRRPTDVSREVAKDQTSHWARNHSNAKKNADCVLN